MGWGQVRPRARKRLRRWAVPGISAAVLVAGMVAAVERGSEARRVSDEISRLEREEAVARERATEAARLLDSLTSRERIGREAAGLGLRPATDEEITFLRDVDVVSAGREERGGR